MWEEHALDSSNLCLFQKERPLSSRIACHGHSSLQCHHSDQWVLKVKSIIKTKLVKVWDSKNVKLCSKTTIVLTSVVLLCVYYTCCMHDNTNCGYQQL